MSEKECIECKATETPQWREIDGHDYCNACGIRLSRSKNRQKETLENKMSTAIKDMKIDGDYAKEIVLLKTRMKRIQVSLEKKSIPVCKCRPARLQGVVRKLRDKVNRMSKRVYVTTPDSIDKLIESIQKLERTQLEIVKEIWADTSENTASERPSKKEDSGYTVGKDLVKSLAEMFFKNLADRMIITEKKEKKDDN